MYVCICIQVCNYTHLNTNCISYESIINVHGFVVFTLVPKMFVLCTILCYVCLFVVVYMFVFSCLFVVYRSRSARVQKSSWENYAPSYVPVVDSFRLSTWNQGTHCPATGPAHSSDICGAGWLVL